MGAEAVAASIRATNARHGVSGSPLEHALFGTTDPMLVGSIIDEFLHDSLSSRVRSVMRYNRGTGVGMSAVLANSQAVFLKVHRRDLVGDRLSAVRQIHTHLYELAFPVPAPLVGPCPLGNGVVTVDAFLPAPPPPDLRSEGASLVLARGLAGFVDAASAADVVDLPTPPSFDPSNSDVWPVPHDFRFDFGATAAGAEWIDEAACEARERVLTDESQTVIGHLDWRPDNVGFDDDRILAVYDWDSVCRVREATLVGAVASSYCCSWQLAAEDPAAEDPLPTLAESARFLRHYELASGRRFSHSDLLAADAAFTYTAAYGSRCAHADRIRRGLEPHEHHGWQRLLRERLDTGPLWTPA